MSITNFESNY